MTPIAPVGVLGVVVVAAIAVGIGLLIFWIWTLVDCATNEPAEGNDKLVWLLVIILLGWIGALVYLLARRPTRRATFGR